MKICHLTSVHSFNDTRIFHKECCSLSAAGYDVHLIAPNAPDMIINGVKLHGTNKNKQSRLYRTTKTILSIYFKALSIDADVYHFHDSELLIIGLLLKAKNKKVIYDAHEDLPRTILTKYWVPMSNRIFLSNIIEILENRMAKHMNLVVTATPYICDRFTKIGCNSININNYPINEELISLQVNWQAKTRSICYCGYINDKRGIFEILAALEKTNVKLLLAGQFESKSQKDKAMAMKGWKNVKELGQLDRNGVKKVLLESMGGLAILHPTPSYINSLPIKMFEYMASAIPVIASDFPLWQNIVNDNKCGICVNPFNPEEIGNTINWIVNNPEEGRLMGNNGRIAVREKYNWEMESKKLIRSYQDILCERRVNSCQLEGGTGSEEVGV